MRQRHLRVLLAALALGFLVAMLGVGRARAADPAWTIAQPAFCVRAGELGVVAMRRNAALDTLRAA
jgi:hypothetical protein